MLRPGSFLSNHFVRILLFPDSKKDRLSQTVIPCPLREFYLTDHCWFDQWQRFISAAVNPWSLLPPHELVRKERYDAILGGAGDAKIRDFANWRVTQQAVAPNLRDQIRAWLPVGSLIALQTLPRHPRRASIRTTGSRSQSDAG